jgi:hypothetical protein
MWARGRTRSSSELVKVLHRSSSPNRKPAVSSSPAQPSNRDPLQKLLDDAETELRRRLEEACEAEAKGVSNESTEEVRRLEDTLLAAALAAKQTIAVRSHMKRPDNVERERPLNTDAAAHRDTLADAPGKPKPESTLNESGETLAMGVREFIDDEGRAWRAWPVVPGLSKASSSGRRFLGDFQNGWICFEGLDTPARRRLPYLQANWADITDEELKRLIEIAVDAPVRGKRGW